MCVLGSLKGESVACWICLDSSDVNGMFRPCNCPAVHRACLNKWVNEVSDT